MAKRRANGEGSIRKSKTVCGKGASSSATRKNGLPLYHEVYGKTQKELDKLHRSRELYQGADLDRRQPHDARRMAGPMAGNLVAGTVRKSTQNGYRNYCNNYIKPARQQKITSVPTADIQKMYMKFKR